jgi:twitching motility protein PilT
VSVVLSLLRAIDRADGEALVMHVGEKPYVVTATGHAELAAKALTIPAMTGMLDQLLPPDSRQALDELGAVEYHLPAQLESPPDARYSVVAARGGDDIWIEVRRRKAEPEVQAVPQVHEVHAAPAAIAVAAAEPEVQAVPRVHEVHAAPAAIAVAAAEPETYTLETSGPIVIDEPVPTAGVESEPAPMHQVAEPAAQAIGAKTHGVVAEPERTVAVGQEPVAIEQEPLESDEDPVVAAVEESAVVAVEQPEATSIEQSEPIPFEQPEATWFEEAAVVTAGSPEASAITEDGVMTDDDPDVITLEHTAPMASDDADVVAFGEPSQVQAEAPAVPANEPLQSEPEPSAHELVTGGIEGDEPVAAEVEPAVEAAIEPADVPDEAVETEDEADPQPVVAHVAHHLAPVVPMAARSGMRFEPASVAPHSRGEGLPHLLQVAAAQGASVLYVAVHAKPSLRVDGEIRVLEHETPLSEGLLEAGLKTILPNGSGPAAGEVETCDVPGVGRVQCLSFRDHRGLGAMFKMLPARAISSEQMGLGAPIHALCTETEGLVLVAGARGAGKSTLVAALVDQMNRTRRDHVITVEQQIQFVHENRQSFVSQREARDDEAFADAVRAALREGPDVLVVDHVASAEAAEFALNAAAGGHLVIASITAATTAGALSRFMEFFGEERTQARITLSEHLRGVITQTLLRKSGGGRAAAREVLVNVPSVAALIVEGKTDDLSSVLNGGRRVGMVPLNDALLALVQSGALDVREAYRKSPDQQELVGQLNRAGLDTTFAERLA